MKIGWIYWDDSEDESRGVLPYFSEIKPPYGCNIRMIVYAVIEE